MKRIEFIGYLEILADELHTAMQYATGSVIENLKTFPKKYRENK